MATPNILNDKLDLVISTLNELNRGEWWQEAQTLQAYPVTELGMSVGREITGKRFTVRMQADFGQRSGRVPVGPVEIIPDIGDYLKEFNGEFRKIIHSEAYSMEAIAWNQGVEQVVSDLEVDNNAMRLRAVEDFETTILDIPASGEALKWYGLPYYCPWSSTALGDFHSGLPVGNTTILGGDPAAVETWRSYADTYSAFNRDDIALKLWKMARKTNFRPPPMTKANATNLFRYYGTGNVTDQLRLMQIEANDAPGYDVFGPVSPMIRGADITWLPILDSGNGAAANSDPLYQVNHGDNGLFPVFSTGFKFKVFDPLALPNMRTTIGTEIHVLGNWKCVSRRRLGVIAKSAPFGET